MIALYFLLCLLVLVCMAVTHKVTRTTSVRGVSTTGTLEVSGEISQTIGISIADSTTDELVAIAFAVAKLKSIVIQCTEDVTLETNDGTTPQETINLKAGVPFQWAVGEERPIPFSGDITAFYFTNSSGATAKITGEVLYDEVA